MKAINTNRLLAAFFATCIMAMFASCSSEDEPVKNDPIDDSDAPEMTTLQLSTTESVLINTLSDMAFDMNSAIAKSGSGNGVKPENYAFSPLCLESTLSLLANSLDEPQRNKLVKLLGCDDLEKLNSLNAKLYKYLCDKGNGVQLSLANSVWYDDAFMLSKDYIADMGAMYGLETYRRDFSSTAQTVNDINSWAAQKTDNMIKDVIDPTALSKSGIFMFNAVCFFGRWDEKFDIGKTDRQKFNGIMRSDKVNTMHREDLIVHSAADSWQMVMLPFKTLSYECLFILPPSTDALLRFDASVFNSLSDNRRLKRVNLSLPSFELESKVPVADVIADLGMPLTGLHFGATGLPASVTYDLSNMGQSARIQVDEEGARLAAVTNYLEYATGGTTEYEKVKIDFNRPFIFIVRHQQSGAILMMGQVCDI
ncbi:MAG: serpin family protein [Muribaculaceae bacterium]|nr:serpin family protein [Muribaculaceae bacterium]